MTEEEEGEEGMVAVPRVASGSSRPGLWAGPQYSQMLTTELSFSPSAPGKKCVVQEMGHTKAPSFSLKPLTAEFCHHVLDGKESGSLSTHTAARKQGRARGDHAGRGLGRTRGPWDPPTGPCDACVSALSQLPVAFWSSR